MRSAALIKIWLKWGMACGLPLLALDQWTKLVVVQTFSLNEGLVCWSGCLELAHVRNPGLVFGVLQRLPVAWRGWFFLVVTLAALSCIVGLLWAAAQSSRLLQAVITLIATGAIANLVDRFHFGAVIDFIVLRLGQGHLPAFNLADIYIALGLCGLVVHGLLENRNRRDI